MNSICSPCYCLQTTEYAARAMMLSILQNYFRLPLFFSERGVGIKHSAVNIVGNQCKSKKIWQPHSRYTEVGLYLPSDCALLQGEDTADQPPPSVPLILPSKTRGMMVVPSAWQATAADAIFVLNLAFRAWPAVTAAPYTVASCIGCRGLHP